VFTFSFPIYLKRAEMDLRLWMLLMHWANRGPTVSCLILSVSCVSKIRKTSKNKEKEKRNLDMIRTRMNMRDALVAKCIISVNGERTIKSKI